MHWPTTKRPSQEARAGKWEPNSLGNPKNPELGGPDVEGFEAGEGVGGIGGPVGPD
jgi:hypothetical protein